MVGYSEVALAKQAFRAKDHLARRLSCKAEGVSVTFATTSLANT